jgi:hypothetical protein
MDTAAAAELVDRYIACWNEEDPGARADLIERTWTADARSVDPLADVSGRDAIGSMMGSTQAQFPGHRFAVDGPVSTHHDVVHWGWVLRDPQGTALMNGFDVASVVDDRISFLAGFFRP